MAIKLRKTVWNLHKWLSYFVFLQIFLWVLGGIFFATVPFKSWVKGGDFVAPPGPVVLPSNWLAGVSDLVDIRSLQALPSAQGTLLQVQTETGELWRTPAGSPAPEATAAQVAQYAQQLYTGPAAEPAVRWLAASESRFLGLVDETGGRAGLWVADFDGIRLYFGPRGNYRLVRSDYWVWYDALWRLHIMDYGAGNDFNNTLLRVFAWLAFVFVLTGLVLSFSAFRRTVAKAL